MKHAVEINGAVDDENLLAYKITVNSTAVSGSFPYLWDTFAYSDGNHTIRIDATDKAGNTASKEITVKVDPLGSMLEKDELKVCDGIGKTVSAISTSQRLNRKMQDYQTS